MDGNRIGSILHRKRRRGNARHAPIKVLRKLLGVHGKWHVWPHAFHHECFLRGGCHGGGWGHRGHPHWLLHHALRRRHQLWEWEET